MLWWSAGENWPEASVLFAYVASYEYLEYSADVTEGETSGNWVDLPVCSEPSAYLADDGSAGYLLNLEFDGPAGGALGIGWAVWAADAESVV